MSDQGDSKTVVTQETQPSPSTMQLSMWIALASAIVATIAASASAFQSYTAYSAKNQPIKAQVISQMVVWCSQSIQLITDVSVNANGAADEIKSNTNFTLARPVKVTTAANEFVDKMGFLRLLFEVVAPNEVPGLLKQQSELFPHIKKVGDSNWVDAEAARNLAKSAHDMERYLGSRCAAVIRQELLSHVIDTSTAEDRYGFKYHRLVAVPVARQLSLA